MILSFKIILVMTLRWLLLCDIVHYLLKIKMNWFCSGLSQIIFQISGGLKNEYIICDDM